MGSSFISNRCLVLLVSVTAVVSHIADAQFVELVEGPENRTVILGGATELKCTVKTTRDVKPQDVMFKWKKLASGAVFASDCSKMTDRRVCVENRFDADEISTTLKIGKITLADAGTYSCGYEYVYAGLHIDSNILAEGNIVVYNPVPAPMMDRTGTTSTPSGEGPLSIVQIAVISASSFVSVAFVIVTCLCILCRRKKRHHRGMSPQQRSQTRGIGEQSNDPSQLPARQKAQDRALVMLKGEESPIYENEAPQARKQKPPSGQSAHQYQNTEPARKARFALTYENAPERVTNSTYEDTVAQVVLSPGRDGCGERSVYKNHQVMKGKLYYGPRK